MTNINNWINERIFYSHASDDRRFTKYVKEIIEKEPGFNVYVAERSYVGKPVIQKLKDEMLNCNAMIVGWTKNAQKYQTSNIISFEIGMAYSLGIPIFIIRQERTKKPWFFDKITDYAKIKGITKKEIESVIAKFDKTTFLHPIEVEFPREKYLKYPPNNQSENINVIQKDKKIILKKNFKGILHYNIINNRHKPESSVRIILKFPKQLVIKVDQGKLELTSQISGRQFVQRNEMFYTILNTQDNSLRMIWETLPLETFTHEVHITLKSRSEKFKDKIQCIAYSKNMTKRIKDIPIELK